MGAEVEIQTALYAKLTANGTLMGLLTGGVLDDVAPGTQYPYCVIGEFTGENEDTKSSAGFEFSGSIHVWSRYQGRKEVKQIMDEIYATLHDVDLSLTGYTCVFCYWDSSETFVEEDRITRHGVTRFRILIE